MQALFEYLFGAATFIPHGYCLLWRPDLVALHGLADALIAVSYFAIPACIAIFMRRRPDLLPAPVALMFIGFITACGLSHLAEVWTLWVPAYGFEGIVKALTGLVSLITAINLWRLMPRARALPSRTELHRTNAWLEAEIERRKHAELELQRAHAELERRVQARTQELAEANRQLAARNVELADANEEVERFAYIASHDLKGPLRGCAQVLGFLREDLAERLDTEHVEQLDAVTTRLKRMDKMLRDLLEFARLGQQTGDAEVVDVEALVEETIGLVEPPAAFAIVIHRPLPNARIVRGLLALVFRNLISNAIKHHHRYDGRVEISGGVHSDHLAYFVRDDGPGIEAPMRKRVFEPLRKLEPNGSGTGMGLAFVKRALDRAGGGVDIVDTGTCQGTTFRIVLPAAAIARAAASA